MAEEVSAFDRTELRQVYKAFSLLGDEAKAESRGVSNNLAEYLRGQIIRAAESRTKGAAAARRIATGSKVKMSSTTGELTYGFASQRFSGGGTTKDLWAGYEFGSNKFKQFPSYSGRFNRGSRGWFIYPTLRKEQKYIVAEWTRAFNKILDKWGIGGI